MDKDFEYVINTFCHHLVNGCNTEEAFNLTKEITLEETKGNLELFCLLEKLKIFGVMIQNETLRKRDLFLKLYNNNPEESIEENWFENEIEFWSNKFKNYKQ